MIAQLDTIYLRLRPLKLWDRLISYALFEGRPLTTSGRWINPLVFGLFSFQKKLPKLKVVQKPIFILGTGRSGTTLTGMLLSIHKDVGYLNEPKAIWHSIFPYEDIVGNYTIKAGSYRLDPELINDVSIEEIRKIYGCYLAVLGKSRVADKYPELVFRVDFVKKIFPDALFLVVTRNGLNTAASIEKWSIMNGRKKEDVLEDWWGKNQRKWNILVDELIREDDVLGEHVNSFADMKDDKNRGAAEWYLSMKEALRLQQVYPDTVKIMRYEDLTREPVETLQTISKFLQLEPDSKVLEYAEKIVKHSDEISQVKLHEVLHQPFMDVMHRLGYSENK